MKQNELNQKVTEKIHEFETLKPIYSAPNWEIELNLRLQLSSKVKPNFIGKYNLILVCIVVLNCGLIAFSLLTESEKVTNRTSNLKVISNELLITTNE